MEQGKPKQQFGLCVKAVYEYENPKRFIEFIEYYIKMGVTSFTFFNASIGPKTSCLMKKVYNQQPDVTMEILPWTLDFEPFTSFYHGQGIQLQECIYRYRGRVKYLISVDLDEFIVPGENLDNLGEMLDIAGGELLKGSWQFLGGDILKDSWQFFRGEFLKGSWPFFRDGFLQNRSQFLSTDFLQNSSQFISTDFLQNNPHQRNPNISAFIFQNGFFYLNDELPSEPLLNCIKKTQRQRRDCNPLKIATKFLRIKELNIPIVRTKYIADPLLVEVAGVHHIEISLHESKMFIVNSDIGYSHHYRELRVNEVNAKRHIVNFSDGKHVIDKSAERFSWLVWDSIRLKYKDLLKCGVMF